MAEIEQEPDIERVPIEAPEAGPEDEFREDLTPELSVEMETDLANTIITGYHAAIQDRAEWETRLAEWEDQYYGRVSEKDFPWEGCSNFHVPLTMMGVETFKPKLIEGVLGQNPPLIVVPVEGADEERKDRTETFLNWQILTELNLEPTVTQSAHLFLQPGTVTAKTYWDVKRLKRKMVREFPLDTTLEAIIAALFGERKPDEIHSTGEMEWEGTIPSSPMGGEKLDIRLRMKHLERGIQVLLEKEELVEHPKVELIDPPDVIAPARGGHEVDENPWIIHRMWLTEDDLRRKVAQKRFYADVVDELVSNGPTGAGLKKMDSAAYDAGKARTEGVEDQGPSNVRRNQYEILEDYRQWDVDEDGVPEEIITWVSPDLPTRILGWDYLDNVYAHGRRPLRVGRYFPIPFRFLGLSFAEVVKGIQDEINTIHNQRVDFATIANAPFYFYRSSMLNPPIQQTIKPGTGIPIENPQQDINFPKFNSNQAWGQFEEQALQQYFERLTGLTDLTLGRQPNRVGATRTAAGTQTLLGEAGLRFKTALAAFQHFWIGIFEDILALDQEYLPPGKEFRVTGKRPEFIRLKDRSEIRGRYDIRLASSTETMNRQQMRQDSAMVMQGLQNPALIQTGLVGLKGIQRSLSDFLKSYGRDPDMYLEPKGVIRAPDEELAMFFSGSYVSPVQGENVQQHLTHHQASLVDPMLQGYMSPEVRDRLIKHIQETTEMARAQQMAMMMQGSQGKTQNTPLPMQAGNKEQGQAAPQPQQPTPQAASQGLRG